MPPDTSKQYTSTQAPADLERETTLRRPELSVEYPVEVTVCPSRVVLSMEPANEWSYASSMICAASEIK